MWLSVSAVDVTAVHVVAATAATVVANMFVVHRGVRVVDRGVMHGAHVIDMPVVAGLVGVPTIINRGVPFAITIARARALALA